MPKENEEKTIEQLKEDNRALKNQLNNLKEEIENLELDLMESDHKDASWTDTLSQEEIDSIVCSKIAQEMIMFLDSYADITEIEVVEMVIDIVYKKVDVDGISSDFKKILSLGLRTKLVLSDAIYLFLKTNRDSPFMSQDNGY